MIFIPKEHEMIKDDFTGELKPVLLNLDKTPPETAYHSHWVSPRHMHRNSSTANITVNVSEIDNDYQLGMHPIAEINRQNESSMTQGNEA